MKESVFCLDCGKELGKDAKSTKTRRCKSCSKKGKLHPNYTGGKPKCRVCGKKLIDYRSKWCNSCAKGGNKNPMYAKKGKLHHNWKGGRNSTGKDGYIQIRWEAYIMGFSEQTKQAIAEAQNFYCKEDGCFEKIHSFHHRLHNVVHNRARFPLFIDSPMNCVGLCYAGHTQRASRFRIVEKEAEIYEEFLQSLIRRESNV